MAVSGSKATGQASATPIRKVASGGLAGALSVLVVWIYNSLISPMPAEAASALTTVLTFLASYFVPPSDGETILPSR